MSEFNRAELLRGIKQQALSDSLLERLLLQPSNILFFSVFEKFSYIREWECFPMFHDDFFQSTTKRWKSY